MTSIVDSRHHVETGRIPRATGVFSIDKSTQVRFTQVHQPNAQKHSTHSRCDDGMNDDGSGILLGGQLGVVGRFDGLCPINGL